MGPVVSGIRIAPASSQGSLFEGAGDYQAFEATLVAAIRLWQRQNNLNATWLSPWPVVTPSNWTGLLNEPQTEPELATFRRALARNTPFGDRVWAEATAKRLGMNLRERGRPKKRSGVISI
jgi:hypothetical protein